MRLLENNDELICMIKARYTIGVCKGETVLEKEGGYSLSSNKEGGHCLGSTVGTSR